MKIRVLAAGVLATEPRHGREAVIMPEANLRARSGARGR